MLQEPNAVLAKYSAAVVSNTAETDKARIQVNRYVLNILKEKA